MDSVEYHQAVALLDWQVELGATEAICDSPVNRYELPAAMEKPKAPTAVAPGKPELFRPRQADPVAEAERAAAGASTLEDLRAALAGFEHCELRKGARNLVFSDGIAGAPLMVVGEAPGRQEDRAGRPLIGPAGQMLDRMLAAIGMGRDRAEAPVYIANVLPWRPPQGRDASAEEIAMMRPFMLRHIALAGPKALVLIGNTSCETLLEKRGITRLRGQWAEVAGIPALPMLHPAYLLRNPAAKRESWADLLSLQARLRDG
ncbi:uracil-DNA glycosylase family protein [Sulfitobacter aestuarii]|uniref:Type-4 uracil-DNA glycosylase n=1 Tax=Sulfitobacter aestuarii TaxID=2161676 RepID=A0ABW5U4T5_9RHOB